jgi:hypothetical protein
MKAKLIFVFFFIYCSVVSITIFANSSKISRKDIMSSDIKEEVLLAGRLETGMIKSISIIPFEVWKSSTSIDVTYLKNLSNITVEIKDESGLTIYHGVVNPVSGQQLLIDIQGWATSAYTITFSNETGGCVYGTFTI